MAYTTGTGQNVEVVFGKVYIEPVADASLLSALADESALESELSTWTNLGAPESGTKIGSEAGVTKELAAGTKREGSTVVMFELDDLEVTPANYAALRAFHNTEVSFVIYDDDTKKAIQAHNVSCFVYLQSQTGEVHKVRITGERRVQAASVDNYLQIKDFTA